MLMRVLFLAGGLMLSACSQGSPPAPKAEPVRSAAYVQGFNKGSADATAKLKAGKILMFGFGMQPDWMVEIYASEFAKFGADYEPFGHSSSDDLEGYVVAFNGLMAKALAAKHGPDAIATIQARVVKRLDAAEAQRR